MVSGSENSAVVTVVIVSYNTCDVLRRCLDYLREVKARCAIDVIVVDNQSKDGSVAMMESSYPEVRLIKSPQNGGFARAVNQGLTLSKTRYSLLLNSDAFLTAEALGALVRFMDAHPDVGVCGPQLLYEDGSWQHSHGPVPSPRAALLSALGVSSLKVLAERVAWSVARGLLRPREVEYICGACMLIRNRTIGDIGGLDETFFMYVEDAEFCDRARRRDWKVCYVPQSRVVHIRGESATRRDVHRGLMIRRAALHAYLAREHGVEGWAAYARRMRLSALRSYLIYRLLALLGLISRGRCIIHRETADLYAAECALIVARRAIESPEPDPEAALGHLARVASAHDDVMARVRLLQGMAYSQLRRPERAEGAWHDALRLVPGPPDPGTARRSHTWRGARVTRPGGRP
jgi:GT2 family glycosyltransferase